MATRLGLLTSIVYCINQLMRVLKEGWWSYSHFRNSNYDQIPFSQTVHKSYCCSSCHACSNVCPIPSFYLFLLMNPRPSKSNHIFPSKNKKLPACILPSGPSFIYSQAKPGWQTIHYRQYTSVCLGANSVLFPWRHHHFSTPKFMFNTDHISKNIKTIYNNLLPLTCSRIRDKLSLKIN